MQGRDLVVVQVAIVHLTKLKATPAVKFRPEEEEQPHRVTARRLAKARVKPRPEISGARDAEDFV